MKAAAIVLAVLSMAGADAAMASDHMTDMDYLKANRCRGLAVGLNMNTAALDATLKTESRSRSEPILLRGEDELARAKRDAGRDGMHEKVNAEVSGPCQVYLNGAKDASAIAK
jgi:hypothetical protein